MANNTLEFVLKLKDLLSGAVRKAAQASDAAAKSFAAYEKNNRAFQKATDYSTQSIHQLKKALDHLQNTRNTLLPRGSEQQLRAINTEINRITAQLRKLENMNGSRVKTWAKDAVGEIPGAGLLRNPLVMAGVGLGAMVKKAAEAQSNVTSLSVLTGSPDTGKALYGSIQKMAAATPYGTADLLQQATVLKQFGVSTNAVIPSLKMLGDVAMGNRQNLQSLTLAFGQVSSAGKLSGQDLLQFINAGFNPLYELSIMTGKSMADLREEMGQGAISADMVRAAFEHATGPAGAFYQMSEKMSQTFSGRLNTFMDEFNIMLEHLGTAILPVVSGALSGLNAVLGFLKENFDIIAITLAAVGGAYLAANASIIGYTIGVNLAKIATVALNAVTAVSPLGWIAMIVGGLIIAFRHLYNNSEKVRGIFWGMWEVMKNFGTIIKDAVVGRIQELIKGLGGVGQALYLLFTGRFSEAFATAKQAAMDIAGVGTIKKTAATISNLYSKGFDKGVANYRNEQYQKTLVQQGDPIYNTVAKAYELLHNKKMQKEVFGTNTKALNNFLKAAGSITKEGGVFKTNQKGSAAAYIQNLDKLMNPSAAGTTGGSAAATSGSNAAGAAINGGQRSITINIGKQIEQLQISVLNAADAGNEIETVVREALRRVLFNLNGVATA